MIIVRLNGGLGNQMFQYAAARRLAHKHNTILKLDIIPLIQSGYRAYDLGCFNIQSNFAGFVDIFRIYPIEGLRRMASKTLGKRFYNLFLNRLIKDKKRHLMQRYYNYDPALRKIPRLMVDKILSQRFFHFDPEVLEAPDNAYMMGSWISEKYFKDIEDIIRKEFTFRFPQTGKNKEIADIILNSESVSLHIRRRDYVTDPVNRELYSGCNADYYNRCVTYVADKLKSPHFFIFSDDISWCKQNLKILFPMTFVDHNNDATNYEDLRLMSQCKHNIIANSSFSWWGAWLNMNSEKIVCAPKHFIRLWNFDTKDILPDKWAKL